VTTYGVRMGKKFEVEYKPSGGGMMLLKITAVRRRKNGRKN